MFLEIYGLLTYRKRQKIGFTISPDKYNVDLYLIPANII